MKKAMSAMQALVGVLHKDIHKGVDGLPKIINMIRVPTIGEDMNNKQGFMCHYFNCRI